MSIWYPPQEIGPKELIGRRLIDSIRKERQTDETGNLLLELGDFHETRRDDDLSVDRLGDPNPARDTLREITSLADEETLRIETERIFNGWATIRIQSFRFTGWVAQVTATPTTREDRTAGNLWHADVNRDGFRDKAQAYAFAAALQHIFERNGNYEPPKSQLAAGERRSPTAAAARRAAQGSRPR